MREPRLVELYCGIGGAAAALIPAGWRGAGAFDISEKAVAVYRHNFPGHPAEARLVDSLAPARLAAAEADLFWLSPPCQPYTRRGKERHLEDPRGATLLAALRLVAACRPPFVALENVVGFETSAARGLLLDTLEQAGYHHLQERLLCPSELGWPNRRPRYYLLAGRKALEPARWPRREARLAELLDPEPEPGLELDPALAARYALALDRIDPEDEAAVASCFTAAYGRSPVRSGSYLRLPGGGLRRFGPREVLRLLGFPASFRLPPACCGPAARLLAWRLAGNSLSLPAVQAVLASLPASR